MLNVSLGWRKATVTIQGEEITADIRPLKVGDMLQIVPLQGDEYNDAERTLKALQILEPNISEYVRNIKGVQVDGEDINPQMLCTEFALVEVSASLMAELISISQVKGEDSKNSEGQPEAPESK